MELTASLGGDPGEALENEWPAAVGREEVVLWRRKWKTDTPFFIGVLRKQN